MYAQLKLSSATSRIAIVSATLVLIAAGILGYTALFDLFVAIGLFPPALAIFFPLLFDLTEVIAAVVVLNAKLQDEEDKFAWRMVLMFTGLGITANVLHAGHAHWTGRIDGGQLTLALFATSLFPLSVALVTHLLKRVISRDIVRRTAVISLDRLNNIIEQRRTELHRVDQRIEQKQSELEILLADLKQLENPVGQHMLTGHAETSSNFTEFAPKLDEMNSARLAKKEEAKLALLDYLASNPLASFEEAGQAIGRSKSTVGNYINELTETGHLRRNGNGWQVRSIS